MSTTVYEVLESLREQALDERHKGDLFEKLVQGFLENDPEWVQRFETVVPWTEWEGRGALPDIGIDLVAKNLNDDGWSAIQCKFYGPDKTVSKDDIDSFIAASHSTYGPDFFFTERFIFDTAKRWSGNAEEEL